MSIVTAAPCHGRRSRAPLARIGAERADLKGDQMRCRALGHDVGRQLALKHRPRKRRRPAELALTPMTSVTSAPIERGRQRRREVARLIGVGKHDVRRRGCSITCRMALTNASGVYVPSASSSSVSHPAHVSGGELARDAGRRSARRRRHAHRAGCAGDLRELLRAGDGFPAGAIELAVLLLGDDENHRTRASLASRLTSSFAASAGEPPIITVCFAFCGA